MLLVMACCRFMAADALRFPQISLLYTAATIIPALVALAYHNGDFHRIWVVGVAKLPFS